VPLFDWDEVNFAECAREMIVTNNYSHVQLYFQPFWEKPPLFIWMQVVSMKVFGISEFAARFPNALCGIITLLVLFNFGKKLNNPSFGVIWVCIYATTMLPLLYFKSGIIDPWFNLFMFLSVYQLIQHSYITDSKKLFQTAIYAGIFLGLAVLTKGPVALIIVCGSVFAFIGLSHFNKFSSVKFLAIFILALILSGGSWFIFEAINGNVSVIKDFFEYQVRLFKTEDSGHGGSFFYHFVVLLFGCFPASFFLILAHKSADDDLKQIHHKKWMLALFWVVLLLFSIVKTKIVHYSSLCYFPLTYLASYAVIKFIAKEFVWKSWMTVVLILTSIVLGIIFLALGFFNELKSILINADIIDDPFALEILKSNISWNGYEWVIGLVFILFSFICSYQLFRGKIHWLFGYFVNSLVSMFTLIIFIIPKVEYASQHAAIEFYEFASKKGYYVETIGFKSYAYLFYGKVTDDYKNNPSFIKHYQKSLAEMKDNSESITQSFSKMMVYWLAEGKIDKPACFVAKITSEEDVKKYFKNLKKLYSKNGFIFYIRIPN